MTYENFVKSMTAKDDSLTRKSIKSFAIKYALMLFLSVFSVAVLVTNILGIGFSIVFLVLALLLYVCSFDIIVENTDYFIKINNVLKHWWLIVISVFIACILLSVFVV